jgi:hypothetical protein
MRVGDPVQVTENGRIVTGTIAEFICTARCRCGEACTMHTLLIVDPNSPVPAALRHVIEAGSTSVEEVQADQRSESRHADRILIWDDGVLIFGVGERTLRWPADEDEITLLLQTGG